MSKLSEIKITPILDTLRLEDISDEIYFSEKYSDYVSNSRLSLINPEQGGSPEDYFEKKPHEYSDSLLLGGAIHGLILQPESYLLVEDVDRPTAKAGFMADELYKLGHIPSDEEIIAASDIVDYYKGKMNDKKINDLRDKCNDYWATRATWESNNKEETRTPIFLDDKKRDVVKSVIKSFNNYSEFKKILEPEYLIEKPFMGNEKTILLDVTAEIPDKEPITLRLKSKLDNYIINTESNTITVNDVKTTSKPVGYFRSAFNKYHYFRELGMYLWLLSLVSKKFYNLEKPSMKAHCLVVETFPSFTSSVYTLEDKEIMKGFNEFKTLLRLVAYYKGQGYGVQEA